MFSEGLSVDFHASEGATVRSSGEAAGLRNSIRQHSQRCLAGPNAIILAEEQATRKRILAGITEAVFSGSGDRIRAIQATAATAGPSIASTDRPSWASRVYVRLAEKLFDVLLSSDCRICGEPPVKIPRLPVCQECLDGMQRTRGGVCSICRERLFSPYALSQDQDKGEGAPLCRLCRRIKPPFVRATAYGSFDGGLRELIHMPRQVSVVPAANVLGRMPAELIDELESDFLGSIGMCAGSAAGWCNRSVGGDCRAYAEGFCAAC